MMVVGERRGERNNNGGLQKYETNYYYYYYCQGDKNKNTPTHACAGRKQETQTHRNKANNRVFVTEPVRVRKRKRKETTRLMSRNTHKIHTLLHTYTVRALPLRPVGCGCDCAWFLERNARHYSIHDMNNNNKKLYYLTFISSAKCCVHELGTHGMYEIRFCE